MDKNEINLNNKKEIISQNDKTKSDLKVDIDLLSINSDNLWMNLIKKIYNTEESSNILKDLSNIKLETPVNSYLLFYNDIKKEIMKKMNVKDSEEKYKLLSSEINSKWKEASKEEKDKYKKIQIKNRIKYERDLALIRKYLLLGYDFIKTNDITEYDLYLNDEIIENADKYDTFEDIKIHCKKNIENNTNNIKEKYSKIKKYILDTIKDINNINKVNGFDILYDERKNFYKNKKKKNIKKEWKNFSNREKAEYNFKAICENIKNEILLNIKDILENKIIKLKEKNPIDLFRNDIIELYNENKYLNINEKWNYLDDNLKELYAIKCHRYNLRVKYNILILKKNNFKKSNNNSINSSYIELEKGNDINTNLNNIESSYIIKEEKNDCINNKEELIILNNDNNEIHKNETSNRLEKNIISEKNNEENKSNYNLKFENSNKINNRNKSNSIINNNGKQNENSINSEIVEDNYVSKRIREKIYFIPTEILMKNRKYKLPEMPMTAYEIYKQIKTSYIKKEYNPKNEEELENYCKYSWDKLILDAKKFYYNLEGLQNKLFKFRMLEFDKFNYYDENKQLKDYEKIAKEQYENFLKNLKNEFLLQKGPIKPKKCKTKRKENFYYKTKNISFNYFNQDNNFDISAQTVLRYNIEEKKNLLNDPKNNKNIKNENIDKDIIMKDNIINNEIAKENDSNKTILLNNINMNEEISNDENILDNSYSIFSDKKNEIDDDNTNFDGFKYDEEGEVIEDEKKKKWKDDIIGRLIYRNNINLPNNNDIKREIEFNSNEQFNIANLEKSEKEIKEINLPDNKEMNDINNILFNDKNSNNIEDKEPEYINNYLNVRKIFIDEGMEKYANDRQIDEIINVLFNENDENE